MGKLISAVLGGPVSLDRPTYLKVAPVEGKNAGKPSPGGN